MVLMSRSIPAYGGFLCKTMCMKGQNRGYKGKGTVLVHICALHTLNFTKRYSFHQRTSAVTNVSVHLWKGKLYYILGFLKVGQALLPSSHVQLIKRI